MRAGTWAPFVLVILAAPVSAQVTLAWKFQPGKSLYLERQFQQKQIIDVKNKNFKQESSNTWLTRLDIRKVSDNEILLEQTILSVTYKNIGKPVPGADVAAESQIAEKLKGCTFRIMLSPSGRVRKLEGYDDMLQKVAEKQDERERALRFLVPETALRDGLEEVLGFLPEEPVRPGATWQRQAREPIPPFGTFQNTFRYTYEGRNGVQDTIAFAVDMKYVLPAKDTTLFRVLKGNVRAEEGKGTITLQGDATTLARGDKQVLLRGNLILEASGNQAALDFTSENRLNWRLMTVPPK